MTDRHAALGLLACALVVRLAWLADFRVSPLFEGLLLDERNYDAWARRIAGGDVFGEGTFTANPLAPYVLGLLYTLLGRDLLVVRVVQMVAATVTCFFVHRIAANLFGRGAALVALGLSAFYGPMIFVSGTLVAEVWVLLFASGSFALLTGPSRGGPALLLAGLLLALAALGRPNLLPLILLLPVAHAVSTPPATARALAVRGGAWLLGAALVLGPVLVRNASRGDAVLVTAHGGVNLWIGNNPDADGFFKTPVGSGLAGGQDTLVASSIDVAEEALGHPASASEASRWWEARAFAFAREQPLSFLGLTATKAGYFLNAYEAPLESNYDYGRTLSPTLRSLTVGFGVVGPLAIVGTGVAWRRWRACAVLLTFAVVYSASVIATFIAMRYRLPALVALFPLAGFAVSELAGVILARRWRGALSMVVPLVALVALFHRPLPSGILERNRAFVEHNLGEVELDAGRVAEALGHFEEAVRLFPERGKFYNNLGLAYLRADRPHEAVEALEHGISLGIRDRRIYRNLAKARLATGEPGLALEAYRKAAQASPRHAATRFDIGVVLERLGRGEEARAEYLGARALTEDEGLRARIDARLEPLESEDSLDGNPSSQETE